MLDYLNEVRKETEKAIAEEIDLAVNKAQKELNSDVFGFGRTLHREHPEEWNNIKDQWNEIFPKAEYRAEVEVKMIGTDLKQGVFQIEE